MLCAPAALALDAAKVDPSVEDLQSLSIEDLAKIEVTSVSKRPVSLSQAASAVYVITGEDIRRSGAINLPEALRLAPNLEVARVNAYSWTVTARGFNSPETANKLLVLVNGRTVYEPIGSGVLWQQVDVDMANVERIEVISGPGGTMWGANAVNGVINVITRNSATTTGGYFHAATGSQDSSAGVRFGGRIGDSSYFKIILSTFSYRATEAATAGDNKSDAFRGTFGSISLNGTRDQNSYMAGVGLYDNSIAGDVARFHGGIARGGWVHTFDDGSVLDTKAYFSRDVRDEPTVAYETRDLFVLEAQHGLSRGRHNLVWGGEFRHWWENFETFGAAYFADPKTTIAMASLFAQDEIALKGNLKLTVGLKAEANSYSGFDWLPNLRLAWQANDSNLLWGAVSRAVRTPNRVERELQADGILAPSPDFRAETLTAFEAGWRGQPSGNVSVSLAVFYNQYDDLRTWGYTLPEVFPLRLTNGARGTTYGLEGWSRWEVTPGWRLSAGFNLLHKDFELKPGHNDLASLAVQGQDPPHQAQLRSQWTIGSRMEFDLALRHVGEVDTAPVPAYTEMDAHIAWRVNDRFEVAIDGLNLLNKRHLEVWDPSAAQPRYISRSVMATVRAGF